MFLRIAIFLAAWGLIATTYFFYPVLLTLCARRFGARYRRAVRDLPEEALPRITMIVAAYNEEKVMAAKLRNICEMDYPRDRFQVLIGSDGSEDDTNAILRACDDPHIRCILFPKRRGKISVLNDLMEQVDPSTEIVVMSDASTLFARDAVRKLARQFEDPRVGCVTGELSLEKEGGASGEGFYLKYERWIKRSEGQFGCVIGCVGAIFAIRRTLYTRLPASTIIEDFVICMRVLERGYMATSEPEARALDPACPSAREEMGRKVRIGAGGFQALGLTYRLLNPRFGWRAFAYWGHKVLRWCVPFFFLIGLAANLSLLSLPVFRIALGMQALGALLALWTYRLPPGRSLPSWTKPAAYFYLMNYALFRGFLRFVARTQRVTWERADSEASATYAVVTTNTPTPDLTPEKEPA